MYYIYIHATLCDIKWCYVIHMKSKMVVFSLLNWYTYQIYTYNYTLGYMIYYSIL